MKTFEFTPSKKCRNCKIVIDKKIVHYYYSYWYCNKPECVEAMKEFQIRKETKVRAAIEAQGRRSIKRKARIIKNLKKDHLCIFEFSEIYICFDSCNFCAEPADENDFCKAHNVDCSYPGCVGKAVFAYLNCQHPLCDKHEGYQCYCNPTGLYD